MAIPVCPTCGGPMAPGDRIAVPDRAVPMPFPAPNGSAALIHTEVPQLSWVCRNPTCVHQDVERIFA